MSWINVAKIIEVTEAEGPGLRTAIWVQGCLKRCQGCCNGRFLRIQPAEIITIYQVIEIINTAKEKHQIEGITLLGGEPFLQAESLLKDKTPNLLILLTVSGSPLILFVSTRNHHCGTQAT